MRGSEDASRASLRSAASERRQLKINSEKGTGNEGRREVPRRTENKTPRPGKDHRQAGDASQACQEFPPPRVSTWGGGLGAPSSSGLHQCILSFSSPDPVLLTPPPPRPSVSALFGMFDVLLRCHGMFFSP